MFHLEYILSFSFSIFNLVGGLAIVLIDSGSE